MGALLFRFPEGRFAIRIFTAALLAAVAVIAPSAAAPACAKAAERENGIDYTKPYIDDRVYYDLNRVLTEGRCPEALYNTRQALARGGLEPDRRAALLLFAAQCEIELGNFRQAI
ncbi:MAG: hypothetical protein ACLFV8_11310, partial [Alphaproteobacteria bacterium]